jgi:tripartite-type tricarboxylate transporter receptor subunit TctC
VPSQTELGFPKPILMYHGFFVHKDTPADVKKILFDALKKTYDDPEFERLAKQIGLELCFGGQEFMTESIKKAEEVGIPILKELDLYDKSWDSKLKQ